MAEVWLSKDGNEMATLQQNPFVMELFVRMPSGNWHRIDDFGISPSAFEQLAADPWAPAAIKYFSSRLKLNKEAE